MKIDTKKSSLGITLIALVITIIVLLILAGVSIVTLTGDNGILKKATEAKEKTDEANAKERIEVEVLGSYDNSGNLLASNVKSNINKNIPKAAIEGDDFDLKITLDGYVFTISGNGKVISIGEKEDEVSTRIKVGDYIDYQPDSISQNIYGKDLLTREYTGSSSNTADLYRENGNWQVLNINEDGSMDLIGTPTEFAVNFSGAIGYNNGVYVMNDICDKLFSRNGVKARNVNIKDMEKCLTEEGKTAKVNSITQKINTLSTGTYVTNVDTAHNSVTYANNRTYYPVLWKEQANESESHYTEDNLIKTNGLNSSYKQDSNITVEQTYYNIPINATNYGDKATILSGSKNYWIASRATSCSVDYAYFMIYYADTSTRGVSMFLSDRIADTDERKYLRPVVSLGSDIQVIPCEGENSEDNKHVINW